MGKHTETVKELFDANKKMLTDLFPSFKGAKNNYQKTSIVIDGIAGIKNVNLFLDKNSRDLCKLNIDLVSEKEREAKEWLDLNDEHNETIMKLKDAVESLKAANELAESFKGKLDAEVELSTKLQELLDGKKNELASVAAGLQNNINVINKKYENLSITSDIKKRRNNIGLFLLGTLVIIESILLTILN